MTGEYGVIDGAHALAIPTVYGQSMTVKSTTGSELVWEAKDHNGDIWFKSKISLFDFQPTQTTDEKVSAKLTKILKNAVRLNSEFLSKWNGFKVTTELNFDRQWGLGTSSTLYCLIAEWADIHPIHLFFSVEQGSGYDVACGWADGPIEYRKDGDSISYGDIDFDPSFKENLYFVYTGKKMDSQQGIKYYREQISNKKAFSSKLSDLTDEMLSAQSLNMFEAVIATHEDVVSKALKMDKIQDLYFSDYWGKVKSLGAWGGDFALVTSERSRKETVEYLVSKDISVIVPYEEMLYRAKD